MVYTDRYGYDAVIRESTMTQTRLYRAYSDGSLAKVGHVDVPNKVIARDYAVELAKAYFATPTFEVGDAVKVVRKYTDDEGEVPWSKKKDSAIGKVFTIEAIDSDGEVVVNDYLWCFPVCCLALAKAAFTPDPDKSYAANQAAWREFHDVKVGDKVKVVRKFTSEEYGGFGWDFTSDKAQRQGKVLSIETIRNDYIVACSHCFPYTALEPVK